MYIMYRAVQKQYHATSNRVKRTTVASAQILLGVIATAFSRFRLTICEWQNQSSSNRVRDGKRSLNL